MDHILIEAKLIDAMKLIEGAPPYEVRNIECTHGEVRLLLKAVQLLATMRQAVR